MLVLARSVDQSFYIGPDIRVTIVRVNGGTVRIGVTAPDSYLILREELITGDTQDADLPRPND